MSTSLSAFRNAFIAIFFLKIPFPLIILGAAVIGISGSFIFPEKLELSKSKDIKALEEGFVVICENADECHLTPSAGISITVLASFAVLWAVPVILLYVLPTPKVYVNEALFYTKAAFLTLAALIRCWHTTLRTS